MTAPTELLDDQKRALPCFRNPGPWQDSNHKPIQEWAARQCQTRCSFQSWCDGERLSTVAQCGIATGVWAGRIWSHRDQRPGDPPSRG